MKNRLKKLTGKGFVKNVIVVATGAAGAQAITILFTPLITRLYGPEMFGIAGTFMAIIGVLTPFAALTYPIAIVLPKNENHAKKLIEFCIWLSIFNSLILLFFIHIFGDNLIVLMNLTSITKYIYLIPVMVFLLTLAQILEQSLIRVKQYKVIAKAVVGKQVVINFLKILIGYFYPVASVLILTTIIGQVFNIIALLKSDKTLLSKEKTEKGKFTLASVARSHSDFPRYRFTQVVLNVFSQSIPLLMLTTLFGNVMAGHYLLARTVMTIPSLIIGKAVGDVFYQKVNEAFHNKAAIAPLILAPTLILAIVSAPPFLIVVFLGPEIFGFLFGDDWTGAGEYATWLSVFLFFGFINKPCVAVIPVLNEEKWLFKYEILSTGVKLISLWVGFYIYSDDMLGIVLFCLSGSIAYILLIVKVIIKALRNDSIRKAG